MQNVGMHRLLASSLILGVLGLSGCTSSTPTAVTGRNPTVSIAATPWPTQCVSGSASLVVSHSQNPPLCVSLGTRLTLIFDPPKVGGFVNSWSMPPVSSSVPSIVSVAMTKRAGSVLIAHLPVITPGTTQMRASVFLECPQSNPTPCDSGAPTTTDPPPPPPLTVNMTVPASPPTPTRTTRPPTTNSVPMAAVPDAPQAGRGCGCQLAPAQELSQAGPAYHLNQLPITAA